MDQTWGHLELGLRGGVRRSHPCELGHIPAPQRASNLSPQMLNESWVSGPGNPKRNKAGSLPGRDSLTKRETDHQWSISI